MQHSWRVMMNGTILDRVFRTDELRQAVAQGRCTADTLVFLESTRQWTPMRQIPELGGHAGSVPAPPVRASDAPVGSLPARPQSRGRIGWALSLAVLGLLSLGGAGFALFRSSVAVTNAAIEDSVVQVDAGAAAGTGFFVRGPDEWAYVATAFHVVDCGCRVSVARAIEISADRYYLESYPDAEVIAFDADADLAIIRLTNVRADRFRPLPLAKNLLKNDEIRAYGFPDRTLIRRQGLLSQEGKILSLGKFPAYDSRTDKLLRDNSTDGLLISAAVEPGYSGGPTCNRKGEVVGVTALKDRTKAQHNGAISVVELSRLLGRVKPLAESTEPTVEQVEKLVKRIDREVLMLPVENRADVRETTYVALSDMPNMLGFASAIRRAEATTKVERADADGKAPRLSRSAQLGLFLARQPGTLLPTYRSSGVQKELADCEHSAHGVKDLLEHFGIVTNEREQSAAFGTGIADCDRKAVRALVWDLTATTLQWEGHERDLTVAKVERVDQERSVYKASVLPKGAATSFTVWVQAEGAELKLRLFDDADSPYGTAATRTLSPNALSGTWKRESPRAPHPQEPRVEYQLNETLTVSAAADGQVTATHTVDAKMFGHFRNCYGGEFSGTRKQTLSGVIDGGAALLWVTTSAAELPQFERCGLGSLFPYGANAAMTVKLEEGELRMYRTSGQEFPEEASFGRQL